MAGQRDINALLAVLFVLLVLGFIFHQSRTFPGSLAGHALGIAGTVFIFLTLIYPYRKRIKGRRGRQNPLTTHITFGLIGPSLVIIHSAHHFSSLIGILIFLSLLLVVLSGIIGTYLYKHVNRTLREQKRDLDLLKGRLHSKKKDAVLCDYSTTAGWGGTAGAPDDRKGEEISILCRELVDEAYALADLEYSIRAFDRTKALFSWWIRVHYFLASFLFAMIVVHILAELYYGIRWL